MTKTESISRHNLDETGNNGLGQLEKWTNGLEKIQQQS